SGTVGPTTNASGGTINPGNGTTTGTLTVNGALTLQAGSTLNISLAPGSADKLAATGAATVAGALSVDPTPGFYGFSADYTILTSSGLTPMPGFGPITSTNASFSPSVTYTATNA